MSDSISRSKLTVLWGCFHGLITQHLKDRDVIVSLFTSTVMPFKKANQLEQSRNNYNIALETLL